MTPPVRIGDLRHRIAIEVAERTGDGAGGADETWTPVAHVWAAVWPRSADEALLHDRVAGRATHDIWIRHRDDVKPEMRFCLDNRVFDIRGVIDPEDRGRWLRCPAEERDL